MAESRPASRVTIDQVVGVLEVRGAPWPFDPNEGVELAEACTAPLRRSADAVAHAREVETASGASRNSRTRAASGSTASADALRAGERERERRGEVEDALKRRPRRRTRCGRIFEIVELPERRRRLGRRAQGRRVRPGRRGARRGRF